MASKRRIRRNACTGKARHASAADALVQIQKMGSRRDGQLNVYRCGFCSSYHIGHALR
jgi:hypothetical protein